MTSYPRLRFAAAGIILILVMSASPAAADEREFSQAIETRAAEAQFKYDVNRWIRANRPKVSRAKKPVVRKSPPTNTPAPVEEGNTEGAWSRAGVSYYGPGLYGNNVGCPNQPRLTPGTVGVAHKSLPCGTRVTFRHNGKVASGRVIDRGPYVGGRQFDLTAALCAQINYCQAGTLEYQIG